jgi:hypothetical protein
MAENRKLILDKFQEHVNLSYEDFCEKHDIIPSNESLITFLIDQNLIPAVSIKRFTVKQEFQQSSEMSIPKTKKIVALSDKFNIPERTIWGILKNQKPKT